MAFVRRKKMSGKGYYQLVQNSREGGKHRQKVLCHLGVHPFIEGAIEDAKAKIAQYQGKAASKRGEAERIKSQLEDLYGDDVTPDDDHREAREELEWRRWQNPYHESAHYYANRHGAHGYEEWNLRREVWDIDTRHLELRVAYYDALRDAAFNKIRASQNQAKLDKLLECQRKYCS